MSPDELRLLRSVVLQGAGSPGSMELDSHSLRSLDPRTCALIRIAVLLSVDSDEQTVRWAVDEGIAAGVEDTELVETFMILAPVLGTGRLTSAITKLLSGLDVDLFEEPDPDGNAPSEPSHVRGLQED
jgi:4-carboxymuconolactone decarboxylase